MSYQIKQDYEYKGEGWWKWNAWIDAPPQELDEIQEVRWILHSSFNNPLRISKDRSTKFKLETGGWGIFNLKATIRIKDGGEIKLSKQLELRYPDGTENTA